MNGNGRIGRQGAGRRGRGVAGARHQRGLCQAEAGRGQGLGHGRGLGLCRADAAAGNPEQMKQVLEQRRARVAERLAEIDSQLAAL